MILIRDLFPLLAVQFALLIATLTVGPGDQADVRVQLTWVAFLAAGWLAAPLWTSTHSHLTDRYLRATISAVAIYSLMIPIASAFGWAIAALLGSWGVVILLSASWRHRQLVRRASRPPLKVASRQLAMIAVLILFSVCVYRTPRSNDIPQFILQQQDMLLTDTLSPSNIGLAAMEVEEVMPRWRANYWHALPVVLAKASGVAVDQVLLRYGTIPVAFSVLLCLTELVRGLAGRYISYPLALTAVLGPALLWFRNFNAFNYSFRLTNNFWLDKDFALFFLIPMTLWLGGRAMQGQRGSHWTLWAIIPALLRFHPMTAIYLVLLVPPTAVLVMPRSPAGLKRMAWLVTASAALFLTVVIIGDAQSYHDAIRQIIALDYRQHLSGRPLHYWSGFYNSMPDTNLHSDTTEWVSGRLQMKRSVIFGCGLLAMTHLCLAALGLQLVVRQRTARFSRIFMAGCCLLAILWGIWLVSGFLLTRFPDVTAGYERLHWFAYPIAMCVVAATLASLIPRGWRHWVDAGLLLIIAASAVLYRTEIRSPLMFIRGFNSVLDACLDANAERREHWSKISPDRSLLSMKPDYLQADDRVLLLSQESTLHFWKARQGVFWSDPYIEAFAWHHRGDDFLTDRDYFYRLLDRLPVEDLRRWVEDRGITLMVDPREGGDAFLSELGRTHGLPMIRLRHGVWRIGTEPTNSGRTAVD